jgi:hypothetical protein
VGQTKGNEGMHAEDQASNFLRYFLKILSHPEDAKKLTHMLMGEQKTIVAISTFLSKKDVHQVRKHNHMGREVKMRSKLKSHEMDIVMLDVGSDVNIVPKKSWDLMGK